MDALGSEPRTLLNVEQEIKTILAAANTVVARKKIQAEDVALPSLRVRTLWFTASFSRHNLLDIIAVRDCGYGGRIRSDMEKRRLRLMG